MRLTLSWCVLVARSPLSEPNVLPNGALSVQHKQASMHSSSVSAAAVMTPQTHVALLHGGACCQVLLDT